MIECDLWWRLVTHCCVTPAPALSLSFSQSAWVVFLHTGFCIKAVRVKAGLLFLPVLVSKWELLFMRFPEWLHQWPAALKVMQDSLDTFPFIVSFFSCIPLQLPRTRQSAGSSGGDQFMAVSKIPVNTGSWNWWLYLWKPLPSYLFLSSSLIVLLHAVDSALILDRVCHQLLLTDPHNTLLSCSVVVVFSTDWRGVGGVY